MHTKLSTLALALLLALLTAVPAFAQEGTEAYSSSETDRLTSELEEAQARYDEVNRQREAMADGEIKYDGQESNRINKERGRLYKEIERLSEDLAQARLAAIHDAPVDGSREEQIGALEDKRDALERLFDWTQDNVPRTAGVGADVRNELNATEGRVGELQAPQPASSSGSGGSEEEAGGFGVLGLLWGLVWWLLKAAFVLLIFVGIPLAIIAAVVIGAAKLLSAVGILKGAGGAGAATGRGLLRWVWPSLRSRLLGGVGGNGAGGGPQPNPRPVDVPPGSPTVGGQGGPAGDNDGRSALERFTRNITQEAREGMIEEAIGRADELEALVETLTRRKTNNAVLTGEAGVGKTALVEELGRKLAEGRVPPAISGMEVLELRGTALEAGTTLMGMFEERLESVLTELKANPDRYIVFVDEMHAFMGESSPHGERAANILKPALARGELRMVGATTNDEFVKIEADPAMARRFAKIDVRALTVDETVEVLRRLAPKEEEHYHLEVTDEALMAAAKLAERFITDQQLPASAVNLLESTCSSVAMRNGVEVGPNDVARIVSRQTGTPVGNLSGDERERVANIEEGLRERMVGQDAAVKAVADAVRRKRSGFGRGRPASFGFFGSTGTGKTELAKALAEVLFGDEDAMVRLDMSEYAGYGSSWKLLGSDKGYVNSDEGGTLTEPVRRKPYSVVLLDEIEKAHPDVLNPLLQVLDDGRLTDGRGRLANFENAMVVLTSNLAADVVTDAWERGEEVSEEEMADALVERGMRPELVQRLGKIAPFGPPSAEDVRQIAGLMLRKTAKSMQEEHGISVSFSPEAVESIAGLGYDPTNGMRPLRRVIERSVEDLLTEKVIDGKIQPGDAIEVAVRPDGSMGVRRAEGSPVRAEE